MENKKSIVNYDDDDEDNDLNKQSSTKDLFDKTKKHDNRECTDNVTKYSKIERNSKADRMHHKHTSHRHHSPSIDTSHSSRHHSRSSKHKHRSRSRSPTHRRHRRSRSRSNSRHRSHRDRFRKGNCRKSKKAHSRSRSKESRNHHHRRNRSRSSERKKESTKSKDTDNQSCNSIQNDGDSKKQPITTNALNCAENVMTNTSIPPVLPVQLKIPEIPKLLNTKIGNPLRAVSKEEKRKLLWGDSNQKDKAPNSTSNIWANTKFQGEHGSVMTEKFRKLMGIKSSNETTDGASTTMNKPNDDVASNQEALFQNLDMQYSIARMSTHTHRGVGLGFGTNNR